MSNKGVFSIVFFTIFLMMFIIGLIFEVSMSASFKRAAVGSLFFTFLLWLVTVILKKYFIYNTYESDDLAEKDKLGQTLDYTISDSTHPGDVQANANDSPNEFRPLNTQQIDPDLNNIINKDPKKMSEIIRKMGFE